ncbi:MAG TPA: hypothetical protein VJA66_11760 [Thermoanaerobaculia bacterium]
MDLVTAMTLLLLLLAVDDFWYLRIPVTSLALAGLIYRPLTRQASFWFLTAAVLVIAHVRNWQLIYNHKYLMTYFVLAIGVSLLSAEPDRTLATNCRLLIGLCFLFAVFWKFYSPDFLDGSFLDFTLLTDGRFEAVSRFVGGAGSEIFAWNKNAVAELARFDSRETSVLLHGSAGALALARFLTVWTVVMESAVATAFLWPGSGGVARFRDALLGLFLLTTYPIASVLTFGWVLAAMGFAQATSHSARLFYAAVFVLLPLYDIPFGRVLEQAFHRLPGGAILCVGTRQ